MKTLRTLSLTWLGTILVANAPLAYAHPHLEIPKKREPAKIPSETSQSGYCCMIYDIKKDGTTTNIFAKYCTEPYLAASSAEAIKDWTYEKLRKDGKSVKTRRYETIVSYIMSYRDGTIVKGKNNFPDKTEGESIEDRFCGLEFT